MIDPRSLAQRLTLLYTAIGSVALAAIGLSVSGFVLAIVTRPLASKVTRALRDTQALASSAPLNESTADLQRRIIDTVSDDDVRILPVPAEAMLSVSDRIPGGELDIARLLGLSTHLVHTRSAGLAVVPERAKVDGFVGICRAIACATIVSATVLAWSIARVATRQALAPLLTVTAELERFARGDFEPHALAVADRTEFGALAAAYNGAARQVTTAFSERRRVEEQIRQFVAEAGHELRTPLTVVAGYVDVLRRVGADDVHIRQSALASLTSELRRMRSLVERLMTLARLDGTAESRPEVIDVGAIVAQAVTALEVTTDISIRLSGISDVAVLGEPGDLYEAVANLLENALKYGRRSDVSIRVDAEGPNIAVRVRDGGPGISEVHRDRIFERFYRCEEQRDVAGSGLGLAIAAKAAGRLEGKLFLEDARPGSTTFTLVVPALIET